MKSTKIIIGFFLLVFASSCIVQRGKNREDNSLYSPKDTLRFAPFYNYDTWIYIDRHKKGPYKGCAQAFNGEFEFAEPFNHDHIAIVKREGKYGMIDITGKLLVECKYVRKVSKFEEWPLFEDEDGKYTIYNPKGKDILKKKYDYINANKNGYITALFGDSGNKYANYALYNETGELLIDTGKYSSLGDWVSPLGITLFCRKGEKLFGLMTVDQKIIVEPKYYGALDFRNGYFSFKEDESPSSYKIYVDEAGRELNIGDYKFGLYSYYHNGYAAVTKDGRHFGLIDSLGNEIIPLKYETLGFLGFVNGLMPAMVKMDHYELLDINGNNILKERTEWIDLFIYSQYISLVKNEKGGVINHDQDIIIPFEYEQVCYLYENTFCAFKNGKWGLINLNNEVIIPFKFDYVFDHPEYPEMVNGFVKVKIDKKYYFVDIFGNEYYYLESGD